MTIWRLPVTITDPRAGTCVNVWHIRTGTDLTAPLSDLQSAVDAIRTFYNSRIIDFPAGNTFKADFAVRENDNTDSAVNFTTVTATGTGNVAPPHIAICVNWLTGLRGRRARGRTFLGPLLAAQIGPDGTINDGTLASFRTSLDTLLNASKASNGWAIGVWGLENPAPKDYWKGGGTGEELPRIFRDATQHRINDRFAVMRSRRPK